MREGLDLTFVDSLAEADFILNTGVPHDLDQVDTYRHFLDEGLALRLPMICANPDLIVMRGEAMEISAGALAPSYEQKGCDLTSAERRVGTECFSTCRPLLWAYNSTKKNITDKQ